MPAINFFRYPDGTYRGGQFKITPTKLGNLRWTPRERTTDVVLSNHEKLEDAFKAAAASVDSLLI